MLNIANHEYCFYQAETDGLKIEMCLFIFLIRYDKLPAHSIYWVANPIETSWQNLQVTLCDFCAETDRGFPLLLVSIRAGEELPT